MHWVEVTHPDLSEGNTATVTLEAFEQLHKKNGWVIVEAEETPEVVEPKSRTFEPSGGTAARPSRVKPKKSTKATIETNSGD